MTDNEPSLELKLARAAYAEAEKLKKAAEQDRAAAEYERGQAARDRREIAEIEKSVAKREQALKQAGEPEFVRREQEAADKLKQAEELMAQYNKDWHAGVIAFQQINEREKAEQSTA
jgi:hypothetical protein